MYWWLVPVLTSPVWVQDPPALPISLVGWWAGHFPSSWCCALCPWCCVSASRHTRRGTSKSTDRGRGTFAEANVEEELLWESNLYSALHYRKWDESPVLSSCVPLPFPLLGWHHVRMKSTALHSGRSAYHSLSLQPLCSMHHCMYTYTLHTVIMWCVCVFVCVCDHCHI